MTIKILQGSDFKPQDTVLRRKRGEIVPYFWLPAAFDFLPFFLLPFSLFHISFQGTVLFVFTFTLSLLMFFWL